MVNRHEPLIMMDDTIKVEGSGNKEWLRRTKPNNSFNRSGNSAAFIPEVEGLIQSLPPG